MSKKECHLLLCDTNKIFSKLEFNMETESNIVAGRSGVLRVNVDDNILDVEDPNFNLHLCRTSGLNKFSSITLLLNG